MDLVEIHETKRMTREEAAAQIRALADAIAGKNAVEMERDGLRFTVGVPKEVELKIEVEVSDDEHEIEIEITW